GSIPTTRSTSSINLMKLAFCLLAPVLVSLSVLHASESAVDCESANNTLVAGLIAQPKQAPMLFLDALRTNPGCRRDLLRLGIQFADEDPDMLKKLLFIARQEFPGEQTSFAELALTEAPEKSDLIREAFFANPEPARSARKAPSAPALVELPPEANDLDDGIREAIARMTAKVEGKMWPEQHVSDEKITYHKPDDVRIPRESRGADESSLENGVPIDTHDERRIAPGKVVINDAWRPNDTIELDETKFSSRTDTRVALEARKREIAPAGAVGFPMQYPMPKSSVYYIPPAKGDFRSTIDLDDAKRPPLMIKSPSAPTNPE
ncbi:MAG: hypothetical protein AAF236_16375, partial [Verrucomicrobiota bacterium]